MFDSRGKAVKTRTASIAIAILRSQMVVPVVPVLLYEVLVLSSIISQSVLTCHLPCVEE